jgi:hypothetical protein
MRNTRIILMMMKKRGYIVSVVFLLLLMLCAWTMEGCSAVITECDAIRIAKEQVPARIAEAYRSSGFNQIFGDSGAWFVNFVNVLTTPEEMGWVENENTHFRESNSMGLNDVPPGYYRNVVIYVDTAGNIIGRELNNEIILGPLPHDCD